MNMKKVVFIGFLFFFNINAVFSQSAEIHLFQYSIRDLGLGKKINDTLNSGTVDSLVKLGYSATLYIKPIEGCERVSKYDTLKRKCVEYSLMLEKVTPSILAYQTKVGIVKIGSNQIFLIIYDFTGLIHGISQTKVIVLPMDSNLDLQKIPLFTLVFDGNKYYEK